MDGRSYAALWLQCGSPAAHYSCRLTGEALRLAVPSSQ